MRKILGNQKWIWFWETESQDPEIFEGPTTITVNSTIGYTPVFYRSDSKWKDLFANIADKYRI